MLHQIITAICGLTLHTQVNACSITLQQATVDYNRVVNLKIDRLRRDVEPHVRNQYTDSIFLISKIVYDRRITLNHGPWSINCNQREVRGSWMIRF